MQPLFSAPSPQPPHQPRATPALVSQRRWYTRAIVIALAIALATLLRYWLSVRFGVTSIYITYFPTVLIVASAFGIAGGIWATLLCALCADYFFLPGVGLSVFAIGDRVGIAVFVGSSIAISMVAGALRSRTYRMQRALEELRFSETRSLDKQRRLYEARAKLESIVECADEAIIGKDLNGIVTSWNKGAQTIFGYTAEEMIGQSIGLLLPAGQEQEEDEILAHILCNERVERADAKRVAKGGRIVHLHLSVSPIKDAAGTIVGASKVAHDITENLKLLQQLHQCQKMEAVGQLTGGIAHDFNNLLAIVLGALELQQGSIAGNREALHRWEVANRAALRGAELTRRLLAFSSMEHFKATSTHLDHSIRNTMEMAQRVLGPEIHIVLNLEKAMPTVMADPSGLESAILNMAINARDAMAPKGGTLTISSRTAEIDEGFAVTLTGPVRRGAYACVSITDTGCGMAPEVLDRACEPFFTTKERGRGSGLGLSMVYGFVKHSGGGICIYSEPGYGTTITFYLPFTRDDAPQLAAAASERPVEGRRSGVILVVDDESELVDVSASYLRSRGYTVHSANSAGQALRILELNGPVDVMVTDIVMGGGMDGMELALAVHQVYPRTRIIYSSGFPADALSERSLPLADSLVLQKPYRLADLGASIDQALGVSAILPSRKIVHPAQIIDDIAGNPVSPNRYN